MAFKPVSNGQPLQEVIVPYSWVAKILKVPVFRLSLGTDLVSRIVIWFYNFFSRMGLCENQSRSFRNFDPAIAQRSVDRFVALGAKIHFVVPRDGWGQVQMMTFQAQDLEQKIQALGGSWERKNIKGKEVFAIIPPQNAGDAWADFKEKLSHFHWKEEEGVLIT